MSSTIPTRLLHRTCTIERKTRASDGKGGWSESYSSLATDVPVRLRPLSPRELQVGDREEARVSHVVYLLPSQDVQRTDRVTLDDGRFFEVIFPREPSKAHHLEVDVREEARGV